MTRFQLDDVMPDIAEELYIGFRKARRPDLAESVWELELVDRCRCGEEFCATFYTQPNEPWSGKVEHLIIDMIGLLCIELVRGRVARVELLDRPDVRDRLSELFPEHGEPEA
jgi:hypothetical protein